MVRGEPARWFPAAGRSVQVGQRGRHEACGRTAAAWRAHRSGEGGPAAATGCVRERLRGGSVAARRSSGGRLHHQLGGALSHASTRNVRCRRDPHRVDAASRRGTASGSAEQGPVVGDLPVQRRSTRTSEGSPSTCPMKGAERWRASLRRVRRGRRQLQRARHGELGARLGFPEQGKPRHHPGEDARVRPHRTMARPVSVGQTRSSSSRGLHG